MPVKHKYAFLCVVVICVTVLCFIWIVQDRLCEFSFKEKKQRITGSPCLRIREVATARGSNPPHFNQLERLGLKAPELIFESHHPRIKTGVITTRENQKIQSYKN